MKCAIYDTYVKRKDGELMHFDIIVAENTNPKEVLEYGNEYLKDKKQDGQILSTKECKFCHVEEADDLTEKSILTKGYFIYEMQGCS